MDESKREQKRAAGKALLSPFRVWARLCARTELPELPV